MAQLAQVAAVQQLRAHQQLAHHVQLADVKKIILVLVPQMQIVQATIVEKILHQQLTIVQTAEWLAHLHQAARDIVPEEHLVHGSAQELIPHHNVLLHVKQQYQIHIIATVQVLG